MILEQALYEDDEYKRLQKVSQGCRAIAEKLPFLERFGDSHILKLCKRTNQFLVLYCYPYNQTTVDMILQTLIERFETIEFANALFNAINEIAVWNETSTNTSLMRPSVKRISHLTQQQSNKHDQNGKYTATIYDNKKDIKLYTLKLLPSVFNTFHSNRMSLEQKSNIFMTYLRNTNTQSIIVRVMDIFQELKVNMFFGQRWVHNVEDSIETYLYENSQVIGQVKSHNSIIIEEQSHKLQKSFSDSSENDIDDDGELNVQEELEKLIAREDPSIDDDDNIFRFDETFEIFMTFITDPNDLPLSKIWAQRYPNLEDCDDQRGFKPSGEVIDKLRIYRSYKCIKLITDLDNYMSISKTVKVMVSKIFQQLYKFFVVPDQNANIYHIGYLIDFLLKQAPRTSTYYIMENNLLFSMCHYLYNHQIAHILFQLLNSPIDYYKIGEVVQEEMWKFILESKWIDYLTNMMVSRPNDQSKQDKNNKSSDGFHIIQILQSQINYDKLPAKISMNGAQKRLLTEQLGALSPGVSPSTFYRSSTMNISQDLVNVNIQENITMNEFENLDIDLLIPFIADRQKKAATQQSKEQTIQKMRSSGRTLSKRNTISGPPSVPQIKLDSPLLPKVDKWINTQRKQTYLLPNSTSSQHFGNQKTERTEAFSQDGFSSSRLKTIYPSFKTQICSEFERNAFKFKHQENYALGSSSLINKVMQSVITYHTNFEFIQKIQNTIIETDPIMKAICSEQQIEKYLQLYLYQFQLLFDLDENSSIECGQIINNIFQGVFIIPELYNMKEMIKKKFAECLDYLCKIIIRVNVPTKYSFKLQSLKIQSLMGQKRLLLIDTLLNGFKLFEYQEQAQKNIYSQLNETVLHVLVLWFFDFISNNIYQTRFISLIAMIFSQAPMQLVTTLLFKLGLVSSIFNLTQIYLNNGMKNIQYVESMYLHITHLLYTIDIGLKHRKFKIVQQHLEATESWKSVNHLILKIQRSKALDEIDQIFESKLKERPQKLQKKKTIVVDAPKSVAQTRFSVATKRLSCLPILSTNNPLKSLQTLQNLAIRNKK
ncbi:hypothetical protein pb186bvf_000976 [Paramecium bursaria]